MRRAVLVLAWLVATPAHAESIAPALAPLFDGAADAVVAATPVPSPDRRVGDVRLLRRGTVAVVQTVLDTALLPRVVAEIRKKEEGNWPPDKPGHDDAARYVATLEQVAEQLRSQQPKDPHRTHRRLHLLIEFALDATQAAVAISGWAATDSGAVRRSEPVVVLQPARHYVRTNMRLIAADSFHVDGAALDALLAPLPQLAVETTACRPTLASASVPRMPRRDSGRARPAASSPAA